MPAFFLSLAERSYLVKENELREHAIANAQARYQAVVNELLASHDVPAGTKGSFRVNLDQRVEFVYEAPSGEGEKVNKAVEGETAVQPS
jgi:hypothetical protein